MQLRPYQERAVSEIRIALARHRSIILALQVGGGKTVIACEVIRRALERGRSALFVVHRIELVEQARDRLAAFGIEAGIIKAGYREDRDKPVQVACVPTLVRREFPAADLVILDECHHAVSASWLTIVRHYQQAGAWVLGITATPSRLDGLPLGDAFEQIIEPVTTAELVAGSYLLAPRVFAPPVDLSGIGVRMGDYVLPELGARMSKLCGDVVDTWLERARGRRTVAFAVNVKHSRIIEGAFRAAGARVEHVDSHSHRDHREHVNAALRAGDLDIVTQCNVWTEGVDIPELECLVIARPTKSLGLHRQMIGRVMRPAPGKAEALVLDHAGNHHAHGAITDEVEWSLSGRVRRPGVAPVRTCPSCYAIVPLGTRTCPECGAALDEPAETEPPSIHAPGELKEFRAEPPDATLASKQREYRALVQIASARGYKLAWARIKYRDQFGVWPRFKLIEESEYHCAGHEWGEKTYGWRTVIRCARCYQEASRV